MTIEEKAKRYDEAIDKIVDAVEAGTIEQGLAKWLFPELKESEDERIRKAIIEFFELQDDNTTYSFVPKKDILAWLEKQGKQNPADKVEPKFHEGDWCIDNEDGTIFQIMKVLDNTYTYKTNEGKEYSCSHYSLENDAKLWNIQDVKDGDVLVCESGERTLECLFIFKLIADREVHEYCSYRTIDKHFSLKDSFLGYVDNVYHPATQEQRDLLFQKMKEAGYEWDAEKKELKKIYEENNEYVDLGLPSGTLWKNSNEEGLLDYNTSVEKYGDSLPTKEELEELRKECIWEWSGKGYKVIGKNGNSIYLPPEGFRDCLGSKYFVGFDGYYWLSTPYDSNRAWSLYFNSGGVLMHDSNRSYGQSVRLVKRNKQ